MAHRERGNLRLAREEHALAEAAGAAAPGVAEGEGVALLESDGLGCEEQEASGRSRAGSLANALSVQ